MAEVEVTGRPRTRTMLSNESRRSRKSDSSNKLDLTESARDKIRIHGKTDPSQALNELQPAAEALQQPTLANLRKESFTGRDGQVIQEPDASNPTRYRWERPLQTIAGFEDDINRTYKDKVASGRSYDRPQSRSDLMSRAGESRRSSYFGMYNQGAASQYTLAGGYYRNSTYEDLAEEPRSAGGPNGQQYGNPYGHNHRLSRGYTEPHARSAYNNSNMTIMGGPVREPQSNEYQNPYAAHRADREFETSSPESDQVAGISTGPSSYSSSYGTPATPTLDQNMHMNMGMGGMGSPTAMGGKALPMAPGIAEEGGPVSPIAAAPRVPMKLDTGVDRDGGYDPSREVKQQRRRSSWFKRRFSKEY